MEGKFGPRESGLQLFVSSIFTPFSIFMPVAQSVEQRPFKPSQQNGGQAGEFFDYMIFS